jgi:phage-related protein
MNPWDVIFYETESGKIPVEEYLNEISDYKNGPVGPSQKTLSQRKKLAVKIRAVVARLAEEGPTLKLPHAKKLPGTKDLWELRFKHHRNIYRILYFFHRREIILVHAFIKKTMELPKQEIEICERRKMDWERRFKR